MIRFTTLSMKNFLSYGAVPTVLNLDRAGTTLILGEDLDNTEQGIGANGVGKTVIINALVYALYDKPISNISKDNLVNNINKKNMLVTLDFEKDGTQYHIQRARKTKAGAAGNWVKLSKDGEDITPDNVAHTNVLIEKILGIPFDLFVRIVAVSASHTPFLDLPVRAGPADPLVDLFQVRGYPTHQLERPLPGSGRQRELPGDLLEAGLHAFGVDPSGEIRREQHLERRLAGHPARAWAPHV